MYDGLLQELIDELGLLPGIGPKTAQRLAFFIVQDRNYDPKRLGEVLLAVRDKVKYCEVCGNVTENELCAICADARRADDVICVVEDPGVIGMIERTGEFKGKYHVLGGALNPMNGIGPDQLNIKKLLERLGNPEIKEVIIATDPNVEGEATAAYLSRMISPLAVRVTRLASGLPVGADLEYADEVTLGRAFAGRQDMSISS